MVTANFLNSSEVTTDRLFQWDIGQKIQLLNVGTATAPAVHFCNKKSDNALVVTSSGSNGTYTANIPNSLLAEEYDITAFIYIGDDTEAKTIKVIHIPVTKRTKPSSYVYTNNEDVIDFMAISAEIHSLLDGLIITPYDNTKAYIKPNIVYYQGSTYICKSETQITGVLPTNTTNWGLMCESGCNISQVTFSNNALHFKLQNNDIIDVPLGVVEATLIDSIALSITKDTNGVLKIGDTIIPQKKLLWSGTTFECEYDTAFGCATLNLGSGVINIGDVLEIVSLPPHASSSIKERHTIIKINAPLSNDGYFQSLDYDSNGDNPLLGVYVTRISVDTDGAINLYPEKGFIISSSGNLAVTNNSYITHIYKIIE